MSAHQNLSSYVKKLITELNKYISHANLKNIGDFASGLIRVRTRLGYGVDSEGGERQRLEPLTPRYILKRKLARKSGKLYEETSPTKSNLTFTGQMLNSIGVIKIAQNKVVIGPHGYRDDGLSNEEVANRVSKKRPFNFLTSKEEDQVSRFAGNDFKSFVKRQLTNL
jgi:hypothetical protein